MNAYTARVIVSFLGGINIDQPLQVWQKSSMMTSLKFTGQAALLIDHRLMAWSQSRRVMMRAFSFCLLVVCPLVANAGSSALVTSDWEQVEGGALRLVREPHVQANNTLRLAIEYKLEPGWHIYWRVPGETGLPTSVSFAGSTNLDRAEVFFPAPEQYNDGYSVSYVYHDRLLLPILANLKDPSKTSVLSVVTDFGICNQICIPEAAALQMIVPSTRAAANTTKLAQANSLDPAFDALPKKISGKTMPIATITPIVKDAKRLLQIVVELEDVAALSLGDSPSLFIEGPKGAYVSVPVLRDQSAGRYTYEAALEGLEEESGEVTLRLTIVVGQDAFEREATLVLRLAPQ